MRRTVCQLPGIEMGISLMEQMPALFLSGLAADTIRAAGRVFTAVALSEEDAVICDDTGVHALSHAGTKRTMNEGEGFNDRIILS